MKAPFRKLIWSFCLACILTWFLHLKVRILVFIGLVYFYVHSSDQGSFYAITSSQLQAAVTTEAALHSPHSDLKVPLHEGSKTGHLKTILLYTTFFSNEWRRGCEKEWSLECPSCRVSRNRHDIGSASAVLFMSGSIRDVPAPKELYMLRRPRNQKWIFFSQESPSMRDLFPGYSHLFNWSSTYDSRSDIPAPYGNYSLRQPGTPIFHVDFDIKQRDAILWMVSNPKSLYRNSMYLALREFVPIDVYGDFSPLSLPKGKFETEFRRRYKFYFALENAVCSEYITEKYWSAIHDGLIPIVLDFGNYRKLAIPNSYIDLNQFKSLKEAGLFIKKLSMNMTAYEEFFRWRHTYDPYSKDASLICKICQALDDPRKMIEGTSLMFDEFYNDKACIPSSDLMEPFFGFPVVAITFFAIWLLVHGCFLALWLVLSRSSFSSLFVSRKAFR